MAIQFPNFLSVPVRKPDYSGLSDIFENYYKGKQMPREDMMRALQAEFARPTAEQALLASKLSNKKSGLDVEKLQEEMAQNKAFEEMYKTALQQGRGGQQQPKQESSMAPPDIIDPNFLKAISQNMTPGQDNMGDEGIDPTKMAPRYRKFDQMATGLPDSAYTSQSAQQTQAPQMSPEQVTNAPTGEVSAPPVPNEIVIAKGEPHLAAIDQMWDTHPEMRDRLKKRGFEKKEEVKFDNKTGKTSIITRSPSGRVTVQSAGEGESGTNLTTGALSQLQQTNVAIESVIPEIEEFKTLEHPGQLIGKYWSPSKNKNYENQIITTADNVLKALGLNMTDQNVHDIQSTLRQDAFQTDSDYKASLDSLIRRLKARQKTIGSYINPKGRNPSVKSHTINDPAVLFTAKKYGITPQQVINKLEGK